MDKNNKFIIIILITTILMVFAQLTKNATIFAIVMPLMIFSWIFLGAAKNGKVPKVLGALWITTFVIMTGSLLTMLNIVKVPENIIKNYFLGFPLPTAILFFAFWMLVGLINNAAYSLRFDKDILREEWIEEFEAKTATELVQKNSLKREDK